MRNMNLKKSIVTRCCDVRRAGFAVGQPQPGHPPELGYERPGWVRLGVRLPAEHAHHQYIGSTAEPGAAVERIPQLVEPEHAGGVELAHLVDALRILAIDREQSLVTVLAGVFARRGAHSQVRILESPVDE